MATAVAPRTQPISPSSGTKHILPIEGMSCASCVARVETAIRAVPGVENVSVNLATERATITAAPDLAPLAVAHAIEQAGYTVGAETFDLSVRGMTCAS
ncbi:MAG TPA: heavy metal-associated domain-containing protein, partial [Sphingomicrobium sp.]|nr:heavy metal-associated domain-containing protein [Sphingomicrobium sp.]